MVMGIVYIWWYSGMVTVVGGIVMRMVVSLCMVKFYSIVFNCIVPP